MSPLRLLILGILFYFLFKLIFYRKTADADKENVTKPLTSRDILVEDPVCHTYVPKGQAISIAEEGQTHYFCSRECRDNFVSQKGAEK